MITQNKPRKIKLILFDADGVLFDVTGIHEGIIQDILDYLGLNEKLDPREIHKEWDLEDEKIQRENSTPATFLKPSETLTRSLINIFERRGIFLSQYQANEFATQTLERFVTQSHLFSETKHVIQTLKGSYTLVIMSNMPEGITARKLENTRIETCFDQIIGPDTFHAYKPALRIFQQSLARFSCKPEEAVIIGDNPKTDILGGLGAGIKTVLLDRNNRYSSDLNPHPDHRIASLNELPDLLNRM